MPSQLKLINTAQQPLFDALPIQLHALPVEIMGGRNRKDPRFHRSFDVVRELVI